MRTPARAGVDACGGSLIYLKGRSLPVAAGDVAAMAASASCRRRGYRLRYVTSLRRAWQVSVRAGSLTIFDAGEISSSTHGTGQGGNVGVTASDILLTDAGSATAY